MGSRDYIDYPSKKRVMQLHANAFHCQYMYILRELSYITVPIIDKVTCQQTEKLLAPGKINFALSNAKYGCDGRTDGVRHFSTKKKPNCVSLLIKTNCVYVCKYCITYSRINDL